MPAEIEKTTPKPRMIAFIILKISAGIVFYLSLHALINTPKEEITGQILTDWLLMNLPIIWIIVCPQKWMDTAVGTAIGANILLFFPFLGTILYLLGPRGLLLLVAIIVFLVQPSLWKKTPIVLGTAAVACLYMNAIGFSSLVKTVSSPDTPQMLRTVDKCLIQYSTNYGGQYPSSLKELGPKGTGCVPSDIANGNFNGGRLRYMPAAEGFGVIADDRSFWRGGGAFWYSDQSGVIRVHVNENHPSSSGYVFNDVDSSEPSQLQAVYRCLRGHGPPYPPNMAAIIASKICPDVFTETIYSKRYPLTYRAKGSDTQRGSSEFEVIARPNPYGIVGLRSFYLDESGVIRATAQDRPATAQDPPIP